MRSPGGSNCAIVDDANSRLYSSLGNICVMPLKTRQEATIHLILNNDPEQERISVQSKAIFHKKKGVNGIHK